MIGISSIITALIEAPPGLQARKPGSALHTVVIHDGCNPEDHGSKDDPWPPKPENLTSCLMSHSKAGRFFSQILRKGSCQREPLPSLPHPVCFLDKDGMSPEILDLVGHLFEPVPPAVVGRHCTSDSMNEKPGVSSGQDGAGQLRT